MRSGAAPLGVELPAWDDKPITIDSLFPCQGGRRARCFSAGPAALAEFVRSGAAPLGVELPGYDHNSVATRLSRHPHRDIPIATSPLFPCPAALLPSPEPRGWGRGRSAGREGAERNRASQPMAERNANEMPLCGTRPHPRAPPAPTVSPFMPALPARGVGPAAPQLRPCPSVAIYPTPGLLSPLPPFLPSSWIRQPSILLVVCLRNR